MNSVIFLLWFTSKAPLQTVCHQPNPMTTCIGPPALSSLIKLPSSNVTWMSGCANAGTSLAVGRQHLMQPQKGWELSQASPCWMMWALPIIIIIIIMVISSLASTATFQLRADWPDVRLAEQPGLVALQRGHWQPCRPSTVPLCCLKWGHLKDGDLCGCVSKSTRESWSAPERRKRAD